MPNFNDAKITSLYVNAVGAAVNIQDDAPNAATPGGPFDVTLEMVAGNGLDTAGYTVHHQVHRSLGDHGRAGDARARGAPQQFD